QYADHAFLRRVVPRFGDGPVDELDVRDRQCAAADLPLQVRTARHVGGEVVLQPLCGAQHVAGGTEVDAIGPVLQHRYARIDHVGEQSRIERLEFPGAAGHQEVDVTALRDGGAVGRTVGEIVAFEDRDPLEVVGEHPGRAQPGQARADDHRVN